MTDFGNVSALVTDLGQLMGISALTLDEENQCLLAFDDDFLISLRVDQEGWLFVSYLDEWEPTQDVAITLEETVAFLSLNLHLGATGQGSICLDLESHSIVLIKPIIPPPVSAVELLAPLEKLMESVEWIRQQRDRSTVASGTPPEHNISPSSDRIIP